jgi:hypothetical protein
MNDAYLCDLGEISMKYEIRRCDELLMDVLEMVYTAFPPAIAVKYSNHQTPVDSAISEGGPDCCIKGLQAYSASFYKKHQLALLPYSLVPKLHIWSKNMESIPVVKHA